MEEKVVSKRSPAYKGPDRRRHKRIRRHFIARFQVRCKIPEKIPADWNMVTVENLSAGGVLFNYYKEIEVNTLLDLQINFPPSKTAISCCGKVIRIEDPPGIIVTRIAAVFTEVDKKERDMISELAERFYIKKASRIAP